MIKRLSSWWQSWRRPAPPAAPEQDDSGYFATQFVDQQAETRLFVHWSHRAPDLNAQPLDATQGAQALARLMGQDRGMAALGSEWLLVIGGYLDYAQVQAGKRILGQDEQGDFLLIVLDGAVAEDRLQPSGARVRLGELRQGDVLGELSMLDSGTRLASCHALTGVNLAVLPAVSLNRLQAEEPRLAAALALWLGKRLSLRLRQVSARLSVLMARLEPDTTLPPSVTRIVPPEKHHGTRPGLQVRQ